MVSGTMSNSQLMLDVTELLAKAQRDGFASAELIDMIYAELRRIAEHLVALEKPGQSLQATAVVHEAYIRLFAGAPRSFENRKQFYAAAAEVMRRVLVDRARRRTAKKRGGEMRRHDLDAVAVSAPFAGVDVQRVDDALSLLSKQDSEAAELVKLRFFLGMTIRESAEQLGVSVRSANRIWEYSRA